MSTTAKKSAVKGVRYNDAQKKEVIDFVTTFNTANGRGGQSKAAEKFNISQITIASWLKGAGAAAPGKKIVVKATKAAKAAKAPKAENAPKVEKAPIAKASKVGTRYTPEQKQEVVDFVASYNAANGRGGQSTAAAKFNVSPLTVMAWLKASGAPKPAKKGVKVKAAKAAKAPKAAHAAKPSEIGFGAKLDLLVALNKELEKAQAAVTKAQSEFTKAQAEYTQLKSKFNSLKASL